MLISSSLSWIRQLGLQDLDHARTVISLLEMRKMLLSSENQSLPEFFKNCLVYEEVVRGVMTLHRESI